MSQLPRRPTMTTDTTKTVPTKPARPRPAKMAAPAAKPVLATPPTALAAKPASKSDTVIKLLLRAKGATPAELIAATDWQPHSLRAFLSGLRKKGRAIGREARKGGEFAYRIVTAATDPTSDGSAGEGKRHRPTAIRPSRRLAASWRNASPLFTTSSATRRMRSVLA